MPLNDTQHLETILREARTRDTGDAAVIATDVQGSIVYWNERAHSMYGWRTDEALGRNILELTPTRNTVDEAAAIMEELRHGRVWTGNFIVQRRDGSPLIAHVTDIPVREDNEVIGIVGVSRRAAVQEPSLAAIRS